MHCLTIDLEDWFHFLDVEETDKIYAWEKFESRVVQMTYPLLDFLDRNEQKATFFVLGWIAEQYPDLVREVTARGHEIACHSYAHPLVYQLTPEQFSADLKTAIDAIEAASGQRVRAYRAPGFSITKDCLWAFEILSENGIEIDSSIFPTFRAHGGLNGAPCEPFIIKTGAGEIRELPITPANFYGRNLVLSGGGYFRISPLWLLRRTFLKAAKSNKPIMTYFHPRDFHKGQPVPELSRLRRFKATVGLGKTFTKLEYLFKDMSFGTVSEYVDQFEWSKARKLSVREL